MEREYKAAAHSKDWLECLGEGLSQEHAAVAVVLYGSHARGLARPESDVDVLILVPAAPDGVPQPSRVARRIQGPDGDECDLDGWLHACDPAFPAASFDGRANPGLMRLLGGRALFDPDGCVPDILARLEQTYRAGPVPMGDDEREALRLWGRRMLRRIADSRGGRENPAAWRRAELVTVLLPEAYRLRGWWYPGPEPALAELDRRAPELSQAFAAALLPGATDAEFASLVAHAIGD